MGEKPSTLPWVTVKVARKGRQKGAYTEMQLLGVPELGEDGILEEMTYPPEFLAKVNLTELIAECKARNVQTDEKVFRLDALNRDIRQSNTKSGMMLGIRGFLKAKYPKASDAQLDGYVGAIYNVLSTSGRNLPEVWKGFDGNPGMSVLAPMLLGAAYEPDSK